MVRKVLLVALTMVALFAAPAAAQYDPLVVVPGEIGDGGMVTVTGQGCVPFDEIVIALIPPGITVATGTADADGNFTITFTVPEGTDPGTYTVQATCGEVVQSETITVTGTPVTVPPGNGGGNLPRTGSDLDGMGLLGAGLLAVGGLVLLGTRRRRSTGPATA
ncbi:MAG: hypothetical protein JWM47_3511 [Acidimicrobiales bacterium]|nr:hypothetical protein [Acidimicrobiales bacterium]